LAELVKSSRESGILIPATSYIVVENQAQWRMLERSERTKLNQNEALEFLETPAPSAFVLFGGLALWFFGRRAKRSRPRGCVA
jgi:hypothetical protein